MNITEVYCVKFRNAMCVFIMHFGDVLTNEAFQILKKLNYCLPYNSKERAKTFWRMYF